MSNKRATDCLGIDVNVVHVIHHARSNHCYGSSSTNTTTSSNKNSTKQLVLATVALCTCSFIHAFVLISVFPYAGYMVLDLFPRLTTDTAGPYAGLLSSSFMAGRTFSSYPWGRLADVYGRKFVLVSSLTLSALFSILFGMSQSFGAAMMWRFLLGLSNGIVGTVKTVVSELAAAHQHQNQHQQNHNGEHSVNNTSSCEGLETKMMGMVVGMRAWGFLISPAIGGWLAEPIRQYPSLFNNNNPDDDGSSSSSLYAWLSRYPFILPNFVGAFVCMATTILVTSCIEETLPREQCHNLRHIPRDSGQYVASKLSQLCCRPVGPHSRNDANGPERSSLLPTARVTEDASSRNGSSTYVTSRAGIAREGREQQLQQQELEDTRTTDSSSQGPNTTMCCLWNNQSTKNHLIPYWLFSLVVTCLDEAFPLFCISSKGGLGVSEKSFGKVLSLAGLFFAACQYIVYVSTVERFGLYPSLWIGCGVGFLPVLCIPLSLLLNSHNNNNNNNNNSDDTDNQISTGGHNGPEMTWLTSTLLVAIMAVNKILSCMFFTSMSIALNKTVDTTQRATLNGFAALGGSVAKAIGPILAGTLVAFCFTSALTSYGSLIVFTCIGFMGLATLGWLVGIEGK